MRVFFDSFESALDELKIEVGVVDGFVTIHGGALGFRLTPTETERFAQAFIASCWEAARQESRQVPDV